MKIVLAPNTFKNGVSSIEIGQAMKEAWLEVRKTDEVIVKPMADGGDNFAEVIGTVKGGKRIDVETKNAIGEIHRGHYYRINKATAVIDLASNCGIQTIGNNQLDALESNTEGFGIVIDQAIEDGCKEFILGLGGSASTDFGMGALYALGVRFVTFENKEIVPNGRNLDLILGLDLSVLQKKIEGIKFFMAIDVENKLLGKEGSAQTFGPQKGASKTEVELLEYNLIHISQLTQKLTGKAVTQFIGGGAAGGTAAGFWAFLHAEPMKGSQFVMEVLNIHEDIEDADLIITTEGQIDSQSLKGKAPFVIGQYAKQCNRPCLCFVGSNHLTDEDKHPFYSIFNINRKFSTLEEAIKNTIPNIQFLTKQIAKLTKITNKKTL